MEKRGQIAIENRTKRGIGIGLKMSLAIITILVFLFVSLSFVFIMNQKKTLVQMVQRSGLALASSIAQNCVNALIGNDYDFLKLMTTEMVRNKAITALGIIRRNGLIVSHSNTTLEGTYVPDQTVTLWKSRKQPVIEKVSLNNVPALRITHPIISRDVLWGFVQIDTPLDTLNRTIDMAIKRTIALAVFFAAIGTVFILLWTRRITKPLLKLSRGAKEIGEGNLDIQLDIRRNDELGLLSDTFKKMAQDLKKSREKLEETKKLERELELAYQIQQSLLPKEGPANNGFEVKAVCKPARVVGGDFYDFIELTDDLVGIVIGDVSGKSIQSALYMAITRSILRSEAARELSPCKVLKATNRLLVDSLSKNAFVTLCYLVIPRNEGRITYASAGHNPILHIKMNQSEIEMVKGKGYPLGLEPSTFNARIEEGFLELENNDILMLFTDGIIEAMNARHEEFSMERLEEMLREYVNKQRGKVDIEMLNRYIIEEINRFADGMAQHDDITLVTIKW